MVMTIKLNRRKRTHPTHNTISNCYHIECVAKWFISSYFQE